MHVAPIGTRPEFGTKFPSSKVWFTRFATFTVAMYRLRAMLPLPTARCCSLLEIGHLKLGKMHSPTHGGRSRRE